MTQNVNTVGHNSTIHYSYTALLITLQQYISGTQHFTTVQSNSILHYSVTQRFTPMQYTLTLHVLQYSTTRYTPTVQKKKLHYSTVSQNIPLQYSITEHSTTVQYNSRLHYSVQYNWTIHCRTLVKLNTSFSATVQYQSILDYSTSVWLNTSVQYNSARFTTHYILQYSIRRHSTTVQPSSTVQYSIL